jgi:hypothetical protein
VVSRRLVVPAVAVLVAAPVCAVLLVLVFRGGGGGGGEGETRRESTVRPTVRASFEPEVHRFGEPVTARIELTVRKAELQAETARPGSGFDPYVARGAADLELREFGALAQLRYTITIQCLRQACLPETQTGEFEFGSATVGWRVPPPPGRRFADRRLDQRGASGSWPPLKVTSWLSPDDLQAARWRSSLGDLPAPTYTVSPRWLVGGLIGGAAALVLLAASLVAGSVRDLWARRAREHDAELHVPPLEQALTLVEDSRLNGDVPGRRVALETLARELRLRGESGLAADAERLAWSPAAPGDAEVDTLVATVRAANGDVR